MISVAIETNGIQGEYRETLQKRTPPSSLHLLPRPGCIHLLFVTKGLFQVHLKAVRQIQQIAQHIGKLFFEFKTLLSRLLLIQTLCLADRLRQLSHLFGEQQELFGIGILSPPSLFTHFIHILLQLWQRRIFGKISHMIILLLKLVFLHWSTYESPQSLRQEGEIMFCTMC